jgi:hypothetical protein
VRGVGVVEAGGEASFAHEALQSGVLMAHPLVQHLDNGFTTEERLLAAIHRAEAALVEPFAKNELAQHASAEVVEVRHSRGDDTIS